MLWEQEEKTRVGAGWESVWGVRGVGDILQL